jgi:hypothetical protein
MSIYAIGFVLAIVLYLVFNLKNGKSLSKYDFVVAIALGIFSWFGVMISILVYYKPRG